MKKISVIVPIYNVFSYLKRCIDSILKQTYTNIEVILVDDGSTDGSSQICDEYIKIDNRIKVIHKTNGGVSSARNEGLAIASGDYLSFIDSDDWLKPDFYEKMAIGMTYEADVINGDYSIEYGTKIYEKYDGIDQGLYKASEIRRRYVVPLLQSGLHMQVWNNLYSTKFTRKLNITFESERKIYAEDDLFNLIAYSSCNSIYKVTTCSYLHRIIKGSLSQSYRKGFFKMQKNLLNKKIEFLSDNCHEGLIEILNGCLPDIVATSLYKESLCERRIAIKNIRAICESKDFNFHKEANNKFSILYKLGKKRLYICIVIVSKLLSLSEPIYRKISLNKKYLK